MMFRFLLSLSVLIVLLVSQSPNASAQLPNPALIGYFHNWNDQSAPYIPLDQIDPRYNIIDIAFAIPQQGTDFRMEFTPDQVSQSTFISQIQTLQGQGKKVLISIGGATAPISLSNVTERDTFIHTMSNIINTYGFDGIDIDLEGSSLSLSGGSIGSPVDQPIINLIYAIRQIMGNYYASHQKRLILTMAPETAFVQGGMSAYGGVWGAYLPVIEALKDSIEILHVQLYNSGSMMGIDGLAYSQGTADFIVAMCEAVIKGFITSGGSFSGLPASKVAVGLPACTSAAGGGYADTATVRAALNYLMGKGPKPGTYTLQQAGGYPDFRGMMTWSINWDAVAACNGAYSYANTYERIFGASSSIEEENKSSIKLRVYPNPANDFLRMEVIDNVSLPKRISLINSLGQNVLQEILTDSYFSIDLTPFPAGVYVLRCENESHRIIKSGPQP
jgi:chitinase